MSDLDEDLLALAGVGGDDEVTTSSRKRAAPKKRAVAKRKRKKYAFELRFGERKCKCKNANLQISESDDDDLDSIRDSFDDEDDEDDNGPDMSRRRNKAADYDDGDDDLGEEFVNPYPLQGKYKDERDMSRFVYCCLIDHCNESEKLRFEYRLEAMGEFEREQILFERSQEVLMLF